MDKRAFRTPVGDEGLYILDTASWRTTRPIMDKSTCINCGLCMAYCPVNAVKWAKDTKFFLTYDYCKGCGICAQECPKNAIMMEKEGEDT
jgi:pyruvate ferredoxin oxidoreductase delta subunit